MRINIYAHLIIIEILDEIYARAQNWSAVEYRVHYCRVDRDKTGASGPRGECARDFVNFREKNLCIARARRCRAGLTVYPPRIQIRDVAPSRVGWGLKATNRARSLLIPCVLTIGPY
jgi:hypothetical protein